MITEQDLREAISECMGVKNPNAATCMKLASYYSILDHIATEKPQQRGTGYSYAGEQSEFLKAVLKLPEGEAWPIMDDLMNTLKVLQPRLYEGVMRRVVR